MGYRSKQEVSLGLLGQGCCLFPETRVAIEVERPGRFRPDDQARVGLESLLKRDLDEMAMHHVGGHGAPFLVLIQVGLHDDGGLVACLIGRDGGEHEEDREHCEPVQFLPGFAEEHHDDGCAQGGEQE